MGELLDAPNQQVVRPDGSAPWEEGTGGTAAAAGTSSGLDDMSKDELLAYAQQLGLTPANAAMSKGELRAAIDTHLAENPPGTE